MASSYGMLQMLQETSTDAGSKELQANQAVEGLVASGGLDRESPLYRAAVHIQSRYRGYIVRKVRFQTC